MLFVCCGNKLSPRLSQLSVSAVRLGKRLAWCVARAIVGLSVQPLAVSLSLAVTVIRNMHISYELEHSLPRSVQYALLSHWRARPTLRIRKLYARYAYAQLHAQSRSEHHKFQFTHTLTRFMSQSSHAPTKFTNPPIRQSVDHQLRP